MGYTPDDEDEMWGYHAYGEGKRSPDDEQPRVSDDVLEIVKAIDRNTEAIRNQTIAMQIIARRKG